MSKHDVESEDAMVDYVEGRYFGKYRGVVVGVDDVQRRGRIKVRVPSILRENAVWALPCVPYAGDGVGTFFLPDEGALVWIEFEGGDLSYPIWVGCFWKKDAIPAADHKPNVKFIKTKKATIRIDDDEGVLEISNSAGAKITLDLNTIKSEAPASISSQVKTKTTELSSTQFEVNKGIFQVK
ncbi:MAG: baseplate assembly protein [Deltaproteobacteria bacterium]|nr:baseplate assembly protein [Deltaproteobacteria bacterium]